MKIGIDFGTNRIVVAAADRGNYPLVSFDTHDNSSADWFPSLIALHRHNEGEMRFGWNAWDLQGDSEWIVVRSIKRLLDRSGPLTQLDLGSSLGWCKAPVVFQLLNGLTAALMSAIRENSNLEAQNDKSYEAIIGVPAHANTNQRFLTVEAFRNAGFQVLGILNEPSAASIEFGHKQRQAKGKSGRETILVYDLGGGTFDASLVTIDADVHHVIASDGISTLGGDDFDQLLADLALERARLTGAASELAAESWFRLLEECRVKKEALNPNSRRIAIDLDVVQPSWKTTEVPVADFYERAKPMVEETLAVAEDLANKVDSASFEALYITGGGSELPLIARVLRERFGRRVKRSTYTRSATAIGLAIQAAQPGDYTLSERLGRYFGVWREAEGGERVVFDPLFEKGQNLPAPGESPLIITRHYSPAHNVGHFRFLECSHRLPDGSPTGDITLWDEIRFAFDPALQNVKDLLPVPVHLAPVVTQMCAEERYECDAGGVITATLSNQSAGYSKTFRLGRWSDVPAAIDPVAAVAAGS